MEDIEDFIPSELALRQFDIIKKWREGRVADVDIYGCDKLAESTAEPKIKRFQILVSLLLSSQTKDPITASAVKRLQCHGLSPFNIRETEEAFLADLIKPVGFYRVKAGYLKRICEILGKDYDDDIPSSFEELVKLPGIGPKMAYLAMQCGWGKCVGVGVDVHVHRISGRIGWTMESKTPESTRTSLQKIFPKNLWPSLNPVIVGFGQLQCLPLNPKCLECPLRDEGCKTGLVVCENDKKKKNTTTTKNKNENNIKKIRSIKRAKAL